MCMELQRVQTNVASTSAPEKGRKSSDGLKRAYKAYYPAA